MGPGSSTGYAGSTQPDGTYMYVTSVSHPRHRRGLISRNDANQQRVQQALPPGIAPPDINLQQVPPAFASPVIFKDAPPPVIKLRNSDSPDDVVVRLLRDAYSQDINQDLHGGNIERKPSELYGPPIRDEEENSGGTDISSDALGNKFRKPHLVYGPPGTTLLSFQTPDDTTSNDNIKGQYIFIPAFPDTDQIVDNIPFAPAPSTGFQPPDGALLAPPAPTINNLPLPSPRIPPRSKFYFKLYPRLT